MKKLSALSAIFALVFTLAGATPSASAATIPVSQVNAGDLVRGQSFPAVYYVGRDGFRYVFPNDKAYFTWYPDFNNVKWLSDPDLGTLQIGGNITYRPGAKMIKINSDHKVYAVGENGSLRWVSTEEVAIALYGGDWNKKIDDVPDGFFGNYKKGSHIEMVTDFNPAGVTAAATSINEDKGLMPPIVFSISD